MVAAPSGEYHVFFEGGDCDRPRVSRGRAGSAHGRTRGVLGVRADGAGNPCRCGGPEALRNSGHRWPGHINSPAPIVLPAICGPVSGGPSRSFGGGREGLMVGKYDGVRDIRFPWTVLDSPVRSITVARRIVG